MGRRTVLRVFFVMIATVMTLACDEDKSGNFDTFSLEYWIGSYQIDTIGGQAVDCNVIYLQEELITITTDFRFTVESLCTGQILTEGDYEFDNGLFLLFVDWRVQEPEDQPEFDMQIFQDDENRIRLYRCSPATGSCTIRLGKRIS